MKLAADFWNCECAGNWVHTRKVNDCPVCGTRQEDGEPSSVDEVMLAREIDKAEIKRLRR